MGTSVESCMQRMQQPAPKGYSSLLRYVRYSEFEQTMYRTPTSIAIGLAWNYRSELISSPSSVGGTRSYNPEMNCRLLVYHFQTYIHKKWNFTQRTSAKLVIQSDFKIRLFSNHRLIS
jgi:hypothetical protein